MSQPNKKDELKRAIDMMDEAVKEAASRVPDGKNSRVFQNWVALKKKLSRG